MKGFPGDTAVKNSVANSGGSRDTGSIPGSGRCSEAENGNPLQYSCLESTMDRGAWRATVHRVTIPWTEEPGGLQSTGSQSHGQRSLAGYRGAWRATVHGVTIPWTEEPGGLQSMGSQSHGQRSLAGYSPRGHNPMDRGAWWATVHGVPIPWTEEPGRLQSTGSQRVRQR